MVAVTVQRNRRFGCSPWVAREMKTICDDQVCTPEVQALPQVAWEDVQVEGLLGQGGFSSVYEVRVKQGALHQHHQEQETNSSPSPLISTVALKQLRPRCLHSSDNELIMAVSDLCNEARILSRLNHEHIIQLTGVSSELVSDSYADPERPGYFLLLEVLTETLADRLKVWQRLQKSKSFSIRGLSRSWSSSRRMHVPSSFEPDTAAYADWGMTQRLEHVAVAVANAMSYLHEKNIVVRDLKPQNIGFDRSGQVKLLDFGMARHVNECDDIVAGTYRYMAPEILLRAEPSSLSRNHHSQDKYFTADIYSFGLVLYELATLQKPYQKFFRNAKLTRRQAFWKQVVQGGCRPRVSQLVPCRATQRLIRKCWDPVPRYRPLFPRVYLLLTQLVKQQHQLQDTFAGKCCTSVTGTRRRCWQSDGTVETAALSIGNMSEP